MKSLPPLSADLVKELDATYPARWPRPDESEREIWMKAGERRLVDGLLARQSVKQESILKA